MHSPEIRSPQERYLPLAGAAYAALMVAGAAAFPAAPGGDVTPASHPAWLAAHTNPVIAQSYVRGLAALAFIALAVAVSAAIHRALPGSSLSAAALAGGSLSGTLVLAGQGVAMASALFVHGGGSADATRALGALQSGFLDMSSLPALLVFGSAGLAALRTGMLPRWLAVLSLLGVPFALVDAGSYAGGPLQAVGILGLVYFLAWGLLTGVQLYLSERSAQSATRQAEGLKTA